MSWSVNAVGSKDKVRESCIEQFDRSAKMYEGKTEQKDVLDCKAAVLAAIDDDAQASTSYNGVRVMAHGSRSEGYGSMSFNVAVERIALLL